MACKEYVVLYTHQKTKKAKTWHDGILKVFYGSKKATLYDEKGSRLDSIYVTIDQVVIGEQLESERYFIDVESLKTDNQSENGPIKSTVASASISAHTEKPLPKKCPPQLHPRAPTIGLKRKRTGFNPPRQIKPRVTETNDGDSDNLQQQKQYSRNPVQGITPVSSTVNKGQNLYSVVGSNTNSDSFELPSYTAPTNVESTETFGNIEITEVSSSNTNCGSFELPTNTAPPNVESAETFGNYQMDFSSMGQKTSIQRVPSPWSVVNHGCTVIRETTNTSHTSISEPYSRANQGVSVETNPKRSTSQILALIGSMKRAKACDSEQQSKPDAPHVTNQPISVCQVESNGALREHPQKDKDFDSLLLGKTCSDISDTSKIDYNCTAEPIPECIKKEEVNPQGGRRAMSPCFDLSFSPLSEVSLTDDEDPTKATQSLSVRDSQITSQVESTSSNCNQEPSSSSCMTADNGLENNAHDGEKKEILGSEIPINNKTDQKTFDNCVRLTDYSNSKSQDENSDPQENEEHRDDTDITKVDGNDRVNEIQSGERNEVQNETYISSQLTDGSEKISDSQLLTCVAMAESKQDTRAAEGELNMNSDGGGVCENPNTIVLNDLEFSPDDCDNRIPTFSCTGPGPNRRPTLTSEIATKSCAIGKDITGNEVPIDKREMESKGRKWENDGKAARGNCEGDKIEGLMDRNEVQEIDLDAKADVEQVTGNQRSGGKKVCREALMGKHPEAGHNDFQQCCTGGVVDFSPKESEVPSLYGRMQQGDYNVLLRGESLRKNPFTTFESEAEIAFLNNPMVEHTTTSEELSGQFPGRLSDNQNDTEVAHFMNDFIHSRTDAHNIECIGHSSHYGHKFGSLQFVRGTLPETNFDVSRQKCTKDDVSWDSMDENHFARSEYQNVKERRKWDRPCRGNEGMSNYSMATTELPAPGAQRSTMSNELLQVRIQEGERNYSLSSIQIGCGAALPHPDRLQRTYDTEQKDTSEYLAKASEKLDSYVVRGSLAGGAVRRQPRNVQENYNIECENVADEPNNFTNSSFYDLDLHCGREKPSFYDPKYAMQTTNDRFRDVYTQGQQTESPSQKVPQSDNSSLQNFSEADHQRVPSLAQTTVSSLRPYGMRGPDQSFEFRDASHCTPVRRQTNVPVWMSESPGELSFLDSPAASQVEVSARNQERRVSENQLTESLLSLRHGVRSSTNHENVPGQNDYYQDRQMDQWNDEKDLDEAIRYDVVNLSSSLRTPKCSESRSSEMKTPNIHNLDFNTPLCGGLVDDNSSIDEMQWSPKYTTDPKRLQIVDDSSSCQISNASNQEFENVVGVSNIRRPASRGFKPPRMVGSCSTGLSGHITSQQSTKETRNTFNRPVVPQQRVSNLCTKLQFPSHADVLDSATPQRKMIIPVEFNSAEMYKLIITDTLHEHLNIQLFQLAQKYHTALNKIDTSQYQQRKTGYMANTGNVLSGCPVCQHGAPSKMAQVKKDGPNKGRYFYACASQRDQQCKFFQWADEKQSNVNSTTVPKMCLTDPHSIATYFKGQKVPLYCECILLRKVPDSYRNSGKGVPLWVKKRMGIDVDNTKKKLYIRLSRKESSSSYSKDDLWIISQHLEFDFGSTFLAKSAFYGPVGDEVEIEPISGYHPSNWSSQTVCHAIHADNVTTELSCILNINDHANPVSLPVLPHILQRNGPNLNCDRGFNAPRMQMKQMSDLPSDLVGEIVHHYGNKFSLNEDQSTALRDIASMFIAESKETPISLIHGVFGAGKSYLLAVAVLFLVEVFERIESHQSGEHEPLKLLISSTTNVAVDRILTGLLALGFDEFVRVGSVKKISKPVLPYSVHAAGTDSQELRDLQDMLKSDLTPSEKINVRKSIEQHRKGVNKRKLTEVRVVGVTCAACAFPCLDKFRFQVVLLDECSQMTEPVSMLPVAKFECHKLVLVGDPKQLDPTIQGTEAAHDEGLEQTLFDRMTKMGHQPTMLRTQYRCHPVISAISNNLFYSGKLLNGISEDDRPPLMNSFLPLCFLDVPNGQERVGAGGSYFNDSEAQVVAQLVGILIDNGLQACDIGVITLYKAQMYKVQQLIQDTGDGRAVQVSTVDAFQGGERGIIILSCVRSHNVGFIDSDKRMNVALTRAKHHLFIVGNRRNLNSSRLWSRVIGHCSAIPNGIQSAQNFIEGNKLVVNVTNESSGSINKKGEKRKKKTSSKKTRVGSRSPLCVINDNSQSPPLDLEDSSQGSGTSVGQRSQDSSAMQGNKSLGGVNFMCGLDHDSSQSSCGSVEPWKRRQIPRLVISDETLQGLIGNVPGECESDSDSELPDFKL